MLKTAKRALSVLSVAAMLLTLFSVSGLSFATAADTILFSENFDSYENGTLPAGWTVSSDSGYDTVSVEDGALVINGKGVDAQTRVVYLGSELMNYGDYIFEADYTVLESDYALTSSTRFSSMMFRASADIYPYYYCTTRVRTTNCVNELSIRNSATTSDYKQLATIAAPAQQEIGVTYHLKVIARGANVQFYIDDALVFNTTLETDGTNYSYLDKGTIGFTTSNLKVSFDNIVVTEAEADVAVQPAFYDTYIPDTHIVNPPSVITNVTNADVYATLTGSKLPSTTLYYLNSDMDITTPDGTSVIASLASALTKTNGKVIPALYVKDEATVDALYDFTIQAALQDAYIVADNPALLKYARTKLTSFYGVLYNKLSTAATEQDLAKMVSDTNIGWGKTVMVDAQFVSKDDVAYMQKRLMNVWVIGDLTAEDKYENIYKGVNGIVDTDHAGTYWIYENTNGIFNSSSDSTPILIREPFMYAHRGYSSYANQNTMPAFYGAIEYGADLIEMDVKLTSDGVVVIYHDDYLYTLTDCEDTTKTIENSTYEELMQYNVDELAAKGVANAKIATLREFLELIDQTDVVGIVEIKAYSAELVSKTAAVIKEMGMEHKVVSICFGKDQCNQMRSLLPGVSVGWLANYASAYTTPSAVINYAKGWIMEGNLSYHPNFGQVQSGTTFVENIVQFGAQRGITFQPWTYNGAANFDAAYVNGIQGITTDYLQFDNNYVRKLEAGVLYNMKEGEATAIKALGFTSQDEKLYNTIVKRTGGAAITFTNNSDGTVTASGTGAATAVLMYKTTTNNSGSFYVMSDLVSINVTAEGGTTATSVYNTSLLPPSVDQWVNDIDGMNIDVTREKRGEVFTNTTGQWPAVKYDMTDTAFDGTNSIAGVPASLNDSISYAMQVGGKVSIVIALSDGTSYQLQKFIAGVTFEGDDMVGNGQYFTGSVKLSDMIPASSATNGEVTITSIKVFNIGDAGAELIIKKLDLSREVPSTVSLVGDVNSDGTIDSTDAQLLLSSCVGNIALTHKQAKAGDWDYDGEINSTDVRNILVYLLNA